VPVAEGLPFTSSTLDAFGRWVAAVAPGSLTPADLKLPLAIRTSPFARRTDTAVWYGARRLVVVDVPGSLRWRRSS
jgi:hypothetical protein